MATIVDKVSEEYVVSVPQKGSDGDMLADHRSVEMVVKINRNGRVTLSKKQEFRNPMDYHFEESKPQIIEAIATAMLKAVELARASEIVKKD
jgi:hypothetical protein